MTLGHQEQVKIVIEDALGFLIPGPRTSLTTHLFQIIDKQIIKLEFKSRSFIINPGYTLESPGWAGPLKVLPTRPT
jgi:hypothetical protein